MFPEGGTSVPTDSMRLQQQLKAEATSAIIVFSLLVACLAFAVMLSSRLVGYHKVRRGRVVRQFESLVSQPSPEEHFNSRRHSILECAEYAELPAKDMSLADLVSELHSPPCKLPPVLERGLTMDAVYANMMAGANHSGTGSSSGGDRNDRGGGGGGGGASTILRGGSMAGFGSNGGGDRGGGGGHSLYRSGSVAGAMLHNGSGQSYGSSAAGLYRTGSMAGGSLYGGGGSAGGGAGAGSSGSAASIGILRAGSLFRTGSGASAVEVLAAAVQAARRSAAGADTSATRFSSQMSAGDTSATRFAALRTVSGFSDRPDVGGEESHSRGLPFFM